MTQVLIIVITISVCAILPSAFSLQVFRSGYPKFPSAMQSCGRRNTHWRPDREPRVVGGEETPNGASPWQVALRHHGKFRCGAVLLTKRLLLTAAHCYTDNMVAVAGANDHQEPVPHRQHVKVELGFMHPDYKKLGPYSHDIAVLILQSPGFSFSEHVKPVCVTRESPQPGIWCEVSGWGAQDPKASGPPSSVLRSAAVPILSLETCRQKNVYGGRYQPILDNMICAGHLKGGIDACDGDSGSPLVCETYGRFELAGLVSWGDGCAKKDRPGVYTNVASFLDWISDIAKANGLTI